MLIAINQPTNQPTNQPINRSINRLINQSITPPPHPTLTHAAPSSARPRDSK